jgi:hypothetical protein
VALRARRAEVHIASLNVDRAHFRLLRKFAPHALLIDEEVLANEGREFLHRFREDPFLQHTQLLTCRFDRLFRLRSGTASIESIRDILEPLGRAETALLSQLGPSIEVEFDLDQFPPHRLIKMLAGRSAPTTIVCTREKETFRWTIVGGKTGRAEVWHSAHRDPCVLSAEDAFDWLLSHNNCHVVLIEPTEFDDTTRREVIPLVENKESGMWELPLISETITRHEKRAQGRKPSQPDSLQPVSVRPRPITSRFAFPRYSRYQMATALRVGALALGVGAVAGTVIALTDSTPETAALLPLETPVNEAASRQGEPTRAGEPTANDERTGEGVQTINLDEEQEPKPAAPATPKKPLSVPETLFLVTSAEDVPCETLVGKWTQPQNARR